MDLAPGSIIAGRYRVDARVGAGGMGEVWAGEHLAIGMKVAIKTLLAAAAYDREVVARFRREANLLGRIRSDHVARVVDFVEDPSVGLVLVMEYIEGQPLSKVLHQRRLSVEEAIDVGCDVVDALGDLHRAHVIHRDMKPGNIMMEPTPNGKSRAIIVDFGMGRIESGAGEDLEQTNLTRADMALGTLEYMAPEQILNSRDVTAASDLYAVGAMLYRAIAGRHIFGDAQDAELARAKLMTDAPALQTGRNDRISQGFVAVVTRAVQRRPQMRYQKAEDMLNELRALQDAVRAMAFEQSGARHLIAPASVANPRPSQTSYPGYAATQTPMPYAQQPQAAQAQSAMMQAQDRPSLPGGPTSRPSATSAPISLPMVAPRRGMSPAAVVGLVFLALAAGVAGAAVFFLNTRPAEPTSTAPAATPQAPAPSAAPAPPTTAAPPPSAAAPNPSEGGDGLEVEPATTAAQPTPSQKPAGALGSGAFSAKPFGAGSTGTTKAPAGTGTAPNVSKIQF
ncbi:serine/threonine-protein kinase [Polyangium mundeleinium]|uniref:Serine/threonine-protein kinase n=1 Tax=Polyangium mundeleinium TaxID=2995306 RepID=A0ABT5EYT9_9BACT|nr:serine/threonine-protein kinase [Polyangium mundeleinium]MDC0746328.1 serine/threonine-protein kinase [Polyangium mundeleinium]